jgi:hypothetical protein
LLDEAPTRREPPASNTQESSPEAREPVAADNDELPLPGAPQELSQPAPMLDRHGKSRRPEMLSPPPANPGPPPKASSPDRAVVDRFDSAEALQNAAPRADATRPGVNGPARAPQRSMSAPADGFAMPRAAGPMYPPPGAEAAGAAMGEMEPMGWSEYGTGRPTGPLTWLGDAVASLKPPVEHQDWLHRPLSAGFFLGSMNGSPLIHDWVGQSNGFFAGGRFGRDFDQLWGCEVRLGFCSMELYDSDRAKAAQRALDDANGLDPDDPYRDRYNGSRFGDVFVLDANLLYYPRGNTPWRPYASIGLGMAGIQFDDRLAQHYDELLLTMPIGLGLKYRWSDQLAFRFEVVDNLVFGHGSPLRTLNNVSVAGGVEIRFGRTRKGYWPWVPGIQQW